MAKKPASSKARQSAEAVARESEPKTPRPEAPSRRQEPDERSVEEKIGKKLDTFPDKFDIRDWPYRPTLQALPDEIVNCSFVPEILDQGQEGACTGFALAAVINYLLTQRKLPRRVSPRMLYEMARCYDQWPGENYEGSSARGAMKGWQRHGVCSRTDWPDGDRGRKYFTQKLEDRAALTPGGAFYRVDFREVRDLHAALHEVGIVYASLMVHAGWGQPGPTTVTVKPNGGKPSTLTLPVITRKGRADGGHAIALVGYTAQGFIVQNSWGLTWGHKGFALLPYEDFMMHATDVWVAQLGVPVKADLWIDKKAADKTSGTFRAGRVITLNEIRPYVIDVGNNGRLSDRGDYWTTKEDLQRLFSETIPKRTDGWAKRRVMLYIHGGLNSEKDVAKRIVAFRDVCLNNQIYPLHIMWESDWSSSLKNIFADMFTDDDERAAGFLDYLREGKDRAIEIGAAYPGGGLWAEMQENARLASVGEPGAMVLVAKYVKEAIENLTGKTDNWELHVVAHSAGSILLAHAVKHLADLGLPWKTLQFMAPAMRMDQFSNGMMSAIRGKKCPKPIMYILSKVGELDDDVGIYGKSLLYLVSNAFESKRGTPLLGMQKFLEEDQAVLDFLNDRAAIDNLPGIVVAGEEERVEARSKSDTHGGFDNDPNTMNSILYRILGKVPDPIFTERDLEF